jgi:hypothetical protein
LAYVTVVLGLGDALLRSDARSVTVAVTGRYRAFFAIDGEITGHVARVAVVLLGVVGTREVCPTTTAVGVALGFGDGAAAVLTQATDRV